MEITRKTNRNKLGHVISVDTYADGEFIPSDKRYCSACSSIHSIEDFSFSKEGKGGRVSICKTCAAKKSRESYERRKKNPDWLKQHRLKYKLAFQARKKVAVDMMGGCCADCGGIFHQAAYDFHHLDPTTKEGNPSHFLTKSDERLKEELSKCVLLCANCHRIRHFKEGSQNDRTY